MNVTWKKPPAELDLKERYAESAVLYFSPAHRFVLLYGTVIRGPASEAISGGDGRVVYFGTWKLTGNSLHVEYRFVAGWLILRAKRSPARFRAKMTGLEAACSCSKRIASERMRS